MFRICSALVIGQVLADTTQGITIPMLQSPGHTAGDADEWKAKLEQTREDMTRDDLSSGGMAKRLEELRLQNEANHAQKEAAENGEDMVEQSQSAGVFEPPMTAEQEQILLEMVSFLQGKEETNAALLQQQRDQLKSDKSALTAAETDAERLSDQADGQEKMYNGAVQVSNELLLYLGEAKDRVSKAKEVGGWLEKHDKDFDKYMLFGAGAIRKMNLQISELDTQIDARTDQYAAKMNGLYKWSTDITEGMNGSVRKLLEAKNQYKCMMKSYENLQEAIMKIITATDEKVRAYKPPVVAVVAESFIEENETMRDVKHEDTVVEKFEEMAHNAYNKVASVL